MSLSFSFPIAAKLRDLAKANRFGGKHALADTLDETAELLQEAETLIRDFPVLIFQSPGARSVVGAKDSADYAFRLGNWTRRRDAFFEKGSKT